MSQLTINRDTLLVDGYDHRTRWNAAGIASLLSDTPPCPVCGTPVTIERIDVTWNRDDEIANGRTYIPGMWQCPRGCNPRTGERYHGGYQIVFGSHGWRYTCSCGHDESGTDAAALNRLHHEHGGAGHG